MATKNLGRVVGLSAYEVWLQEGNNGTETDFLNSLKGEQGQQGIQGQQGERGQQGEKGEQGEKGKDGHTPIKGTDYFTEQDIAEIVNAIYLKVADGNEVSY